MPTTGGFGLLSAPGTSSLDRVLVRLAAFLSFSAGLAFFAAGIALDDPMWIRGIVGPFSVTIVALWQVARHREHLVSILVLAAVATVAQNVILDLPGLSQASAIVLAFVGIIGALFVERHVVLYVTTYALLMLASRAYWAWTGAETAGTAFLNGAIAALSVIFGASVMIWLKRQLAVTAGRHQNLFRNAPISLWEEDFSAVGQWLDGLRAQGVTDLEGHLADRPEVLDEVAALIEVTAVNDAAVTLMEVDREEDLLGHLVRVNESVKRSIVPQLLAIWNDEANVVIELAGAESAKGTVMEALLYWSAPRVEGRLDLTRVTVSVVDVTDQMQTERQLQDLLRSKDEFVATVSHELRTPLTAVVGLAEELRDHEEVFGDDERRELVALIAEQGLEVSKIVEDLLVAARAEAGTLDVTIEPLDVLAEVGSVLRTHGLADQIALEVRGEIPAVLGDTGRVRQIVRNLLTNTQRYGGPRIRIVIEDRGRFVDLEVRDDGDALPDQLREAIFDPYYRAKQVKGVTASVGLGLTVSRDLARRMGGDLIYDHDGRETVFTLRVRKAAAAHPAQLAASAAPLMRRET